MKKCKIKIILCQKKPKTSIRKGLKELEKTVKKELLKL